MRSGERVAAYGRGRESRTSLASSASFAYPTAPRPGCLTTEREQRAEQHLEQRVANSEGINGKCVST